MKNPGHVPSIFHERIHQRPVILAMIAGGLLGAASFARGDSVQPTSRPSDQDQNTAELRQEINALNAKVDRLESKEQSAAVPATQPVAVVTSQLGAAGPFCHPGLRHRLRSAGRVCDSQR